MTTEWHRYGWAVAAVALLGSGVIAYAMLGPLGLGLVGAALLFVASRIELDDRMPVGEDGSPSLLAAPRAESRGNTNADEVMRAHSETRAFLRRTSLAKELGLAFMAAAAALMMLAP